MSQGHVPADWKTSVIISIPNCSSNLDKPANYRPISLLSLLASYLKNMFTLSFTNFVSNTTSSPLLNLASSTSVHIISPTLCKPLFSLSSTKINNKSVNACLHDLKKAFDSVPHKPLIDRLSSLHFPPYLINWLHSHISAHSQQVIISGTSSSPLPLYL